MRKRIIILLNIILVCTIIVVGCSNTEKNETNTGDISKAEDSPSVDKIDYADAYYWISKPEIEKEVDVFYVYPTISMDESGNMSISNEEERLVAKNITSSQSSVFTSNANVFAPYYRQLSGEADTSEYADVFDSPELKKSAADVQDAFDYYINNLNEGRPFIIAGHSQGTMVLMELLKNKFADNKKLREQLVAAYLIGYTITDENLEEYNLKVAESANDTGVVITYNTQSEDAEKGHILLSGANCINPLNWKTDSTYAPASENLGARFYDDSTGELVREVNNYSDAYIDVETGALVTYVPEEEELDLGPQPEGVYHRYDYVFWANNLEENVSIRIDTYLNTH
jgi:hypothetical protein